jgi:hypothetical protein
MSRDKVLRKKVANVEIRKVEEFRNKFHYLAEINPYQSEAQFNALVRDIELNGQLEPVKLYRGKIVDGRHRWLALESLGEKTIKCVQLPNAYTLDKVKEVVFSMETRRHQDTTSKVIVAYRDYLQSDETQQEIAKKHGVSQVDISHCKIIDSLSPGITKLLFEGNSFKLNDYKTTRSLKKIATVLRERNKKNKNTATPEEEKMLNVYRKFLKLSPALQSMFVDKLKKEEYIY